MNKNTTYIIAAVVVIIIVIAGVGVYLYNNGTGTSPSGTPTPTPIANTYTVNNATSLQFAANSTSSGTTTTLLFAGENLQTSNKTIRIDLPAYNQSYVLNYGTQKSYTSTDGGKTWTLDSSFTSDNNIWGARWDGEISALGNWTGTGDYSYTITASGVTSNVVIYNIQINPSISESFFATPTS